MTNFILLLILLSLIGVPIVSIIDSLLGIALALIIFGAVAVMLMVFDLWWVPFAVATGLLIAYLANRYRPAVRQRPIRTLSNGAKACDID